MEGIFLMTRGVFDGTKFGRIRNGFVRGGHVERDLGKLWRVVSSLRAVR